MKTILIADDHELIREGMRSIIEQSPKKYRIIEATSCAQVKHILSRQKVHYAILDMMFTDGNLFISPESALNFCKQTRILIYSANAERLYAKRLLQKGARGYLCKLASVEELQEAIQTVLQDQVYLSSAFKKMILKQAGANSEDPIDTLTDRELAVAESIIAGIALGEIAEQLSLDASTISNYRRRLFKKMSVANAMELKDKFLWYRMNE